MALTPGGGGGAPGGVDFEALRQQAMDAYLQSGQVPLGGAPAPEEDPNALSPKALKFSDFFAPLDPVERVERPRPFVMGAPPPPGIALPKGTRTLSRGPKRVGSLGRATAMDRERLAAIVEKFLGEAPAPEDLVDAWAWGVQQVDLAEKMGLESHDPWYWLEQRAETAAGSRARSEGPSTVTATQRTINLTDPETLRAVARSAWSQAVGRDISDEEFAEFMAQANEMERANPTITTTTSTTSETGETVEQSSTTEGGAPAPGVMAENYLDEELDSEMDAYRAGTRYFEVAQALAGGII